MTTRPAPLLTANGQWIPIARESLRVLHRAEYSDSLGPIQRECWVIATEHGRDHISAHASEGEAIAHLHSIIRRAHSPEAVSRGWLELSAADCDLSLSLPSRDA